MRTSFATSTTKRDSKSIGIGKNVNK
jgi:hypothetical protein